MASPSPVPSLTFPGWDAYLVKLVEYGSQFLVGDADAGVPDTEARSIVAAAAVNPDAAILRA